MFFLKENLLADDYDWSNDYHHNQLSDEATRKRFDRFNGYDILHIIDLFDRSVEKLTIEQAQRIEQLIQTELPLEIKSEITVLQWLKERRVQIFQLEMAHPLYIIVEKK